MGAAGIGGVAGLDRNGAERRGRNHHDSPSSRHGEVLAGVFPFIVSPNFTALPAAPVPFQNAVTTLQLPPVYTTSGQLAFPTGRTTDVAPNTQLDVPRFQADLSALTPGHQPQPLAVFGTSPNLPNGYIENYTAGIEQTFKDVVVNASYVGTAGVKLLSVISPNSYSGASPQFAPFTQFDSSGQVVGGYGPETLFGIAFPLHLPRPPGFRIQELSPAGIGLSIRVHFQQIARRHQRNRLPFRRGRRHCPPDFAAGPLESWRRQRALNL